jgi:hypothetical protein
MKLTPYLLLTTLCLLVNASQSKQPKTILAIGDSITQGGGNFICYRQILVPELKKRGFALEFIGPK